MSYESGDLSFVKDDIITLLRQVNGPHLRMSMGDERALAEQRKKEMGKDIFISLLR